MTLPPSSDQGGGKAFYDAPSLRESERVQTDDLPARLGIQIECEPAHLDSAIAVLKAELQRFRHYTRLGWGWRCRNGAIGPWFFVRRVGRGLSVRQDRVADALVAVSPGNRKDGASQQDSTHPKGDAR